MSDQSVKSWNAQLLNRFTSDRITPIPTSQLDFAPNFNARASNTFNSMFNDDIRQLNLINTLENPTTNMQPRYSVLSEQTPKEQQQKEAMNTLFDIPSRVKNLNVNQVRVRDDDSLNPQPLITNVKPVEQFTPIKKASVEDVVLIGIIIVVIVCLLFFVVNIYIQTKKMEFMMYFMRIQFAKESKTIGLQNGDAI